MQLKDVHENCGPQAYLYLSLHKQIIYFLILVNIFGVSALIPIYFQGPGVTGQDTNRESMGNIIEDPDYMVASVIYFALFSLGSYWLLYVILRYMSNLSNLFVIFT